MKQLLHDFLSHPWVDCKEAADGADGRAECGKRGTSWGSSRNRYRKSATAVRRVTDVPTVLPSLIFDFVPGTSPSWSLKVCTLHGRTPYPATVDCGSGRLWGVAWLRTGQGGGVQWWCWQGIDARSGGRVAGGEGSWWQQL